MTYQELFYIQSMTFFPTLTLLTTLQILLMTTPAYPEGPGGEECIRILLLTHMFPSNLIPQAATIPWICLTGICKVIPSSFSPAPAYIAPIGPPCSPPLLMSYPIPPL